VVMGIVYHKSEAGTMKVRKLHKIFTFKSYVHHIDMVG